MCVLSELQFVKTTVQDTAAAIRTRNTASVRRSGWRTYLKHTLQTPRATAVSVWVCLCARGRACVTVCGGREGCCVKHCLKGCDTLKDEYLE